MNLSNNNNNNSNPIPPSLQTCSHDKGNIIALFNYVNIPLIPLFLYGSLSLLLFRYYHKKLGVMCMLGALCLLISELSDSLDSSLDIFFYNKLLSGGITSNNNSSSSSNSSKQQQEQKKYVIGYVVYSVFFDVVKYPIMALGYLLLFFGLYYSIYFHMIANTTDASSSSSSSSSSNSNRSNRSKHHIDDDDDDDIEYKSNNKYHNNINNNNNNNNSNHFSSMHKRYYDELGLKTKNIQRVIWKRRISMILIPLACLLLIALMSGGVGLVIDFLLLYPRYARQQQQQSPSQQNSSLESSSSMSSFEIVSTTIRHTLERHSFQLKMNKGVHDYLHDASSSSSSIRSSNRHHDASSLVLNLNSNSNTNKIINGTYIGNSGIITLRPEMWKLFLLLSVISFQIAICLALIWLCRHYLLSTHTRLGAAVLYTLCMICQVSSTILYGLEDFTAYHNGVWCMAFRYFRIVFNFLSFVFFAVPTVFVFIGVRRHNRNVESYKHLTERFLDHVAMQPRNRDARRFSSSTIGGFTYDIDNEYMNTVAPRMRMLEDYD